jgi:hypothetical protein
MAAQVGTRAADCNSSLDTNCFNPERIDAAAAAFDAPDSENLKHG